MQEIEQYGPMEREEQPYSPGFPGITIDQSNLWKENLDTQKLLEYIEKMLKGYEWNEQKEEWVQSLITIQDREGKLHEVWEGPLMDPQEIRIIITWLRTHLNANTFLSKIKEDQINNISYEAVWVLEKMFYKLRTKIPPHYRALLSNTMENAIYIGLSRAGEGREGMTLGAISKTSHSIEHIQDTPKTKEDNKIKLFGW